MLTRQNYLKTLLISWATMMFITYICTATFSCTKSLLTSRHENPKKKKKRKKKNFFIFMNYYTGATAAR